MLHPTDKRSREEVNTENQWKDQIVLSSKSSAEDEKDLCPQFKTKHSRLSITMPANNNMACLRHNLYLFQIVYALTLLHLHPIASMTSSSVACSSPLYFLPLTWFMFPKAI